jgi:mono/diheme cytochrome c family protein
MRRSLTAAATCFIAAAASAFALSSQSASARQVPATDAVAANQATVQKYCVSCHNERVKSGGLALTALDLARAPKDAEAWEHVIRKVRTGAMPPAGRPRPDKATATGLVTYLESELDKAALANPNPGRLALARLNRAEYRNAVRDVLGLEIDAASMLPRRSASRIARRRRAALLLSGRRRISVRDAAQRGRRRRRVRGHHGRAASARHRHR